MVGAGHHVRAKTNTPVIGILTQPIPSESYQWQKEFERIENEVKSQETNTFHIQNLTGQFIESTHVKFLEAAGARVVPIHYDWKETDLRRELESINGLYIPGDSKELLSERHFEYIKTVQKILLWAQAFNEAEDNHFPVFGVGYGLMAMMRAEMLNTESFSDFEARGKLQMNLIREPEHTYLFDEFSQEKLENMLDKIKFFADVEIGVTTNDFILEHKILSSLFVPVSTFHDEELPNSNDEIVAAMEGVVYPWFAVAYRIDRIQYSMERGIRDLMDHSREAIMHAQKMANLFVDEARLSGHLYRYVSYEMNAVAKLTDADTHLVEVPLIMSNPSRTIRTEIYVF